MIQIDRASAIPNLKGLSSYARGEIALSQGVWMVVQASQEVWVAHRDETPIAVMGVIKPTFLSVARLWFLLYDEAEKNIRGNLRAARTVFPELYRRFGKLETAVEEGWRPGERFAKFFGFAPTEQRETHGGRVYKIYEVTF